MIAFARPKRAITINWGIALLAYAIAGALIGGYIARIGGSGHRYERRHRAALQRGEARLEAIELD